MGSSWQQGIINTFTMHQGGPWSNKDMQHTMLVRVSLYIDETRANHQGVLWWAGGLLGIFLSRGGRRSFVPAVMYVRFYPNLPDTDDSVSSWQDGEWVHTNNTWWSQARSMGCSATPSLPLGWWDWLRSASCSMIMRRRMELSGYSSTCLHMWVTSNMTWIMLMKQLLVLGGYVRDPATDTELTI